MAQRCGGALLARGARAGGEEQVEAPWKKKGLSPVHRVAASRVPASDEGHPRRIECEASGSARVHRGGYRRKKKRMAGASSVWPSSRRRRATESQAC